MSDITRKENNSLIKPSTTSIIQKLRGASRAFLVDISGSMDAYTADGRRIDIVNGLLESLEEELKTTRLFKFSDYCEEIKINSLTKLAKLTTEGGTSMHKAFEKMHQERIKDVVLLTDGQPDLEKEALSAARGLKIDIVYIGPQPMPEFPKKLALATGGSFADQNLLKSGASLLLKERIKGLLGA